MILTITMNPSIDHIYILNSLKLGKVNRVKNPQIDIGGKGINTARTIKILGGDVALTGFLGGNSGKLAENHLKDDGFKYIDMVSIDGKTRNAITLMHDNNTHTEIVEEGPLVGKIDMTLLMKKIEKLIHQFDVKTVCINGTVNSSENNIFPKLINFIRNIHSKDITILVDISGNPLRELLIGDEKNTPDFIKPNIHEISDIAGRTFLNKCELIEYIKYSSFNPISIIMISCGEQGAIVKYHNHIYDVKIPKIDILNPTGSGDATVGGFAYALENKFNIEDQIKFAMACGMSNAQHQRVGFINKIETVKFAKKVIITEI